MVRKRWVDLNECATVSLPRVLTLHALPTKRPLGGLRGAYHSVVETLRLDVRFARNLIHGLDAMISPEQWICRGVAKDTRKGNRIDLFAQSARFQALFPAITEAAILLLIFQAVGRHNGTAVWNISVVSS